VRSGRGSAGEGTRGRLGAGLVRVEPVPVADPRSMVLENPEVPERKRYCGACEAPVGRGRDGRPGRTEGFCTKCGTEYSFSPKLLAGDMVGGQYEVVGCLAHGGLGWIYLAVDRRVNDRWVALKGLLNTGDAEAIRQTIAERRYLAEVDHPNLVRIINFAEHPNPRTGGTDGYIVMEYVGGRSLRDLAASRRTPEGRRDPLPVEQAIAYALEALPALGYLHSRGLIYCDFKPDNVIQHEDTLKIIDMGAVRHVDDEGPIYGTIGYQAPEVAAEGLVLPASDLYTVARTLAVLSFDFQGFTTVYRDTLPGPEEVEVFDRYESYYRLLVRATDPDPERRFSSAEEMAGQLTGVLREILSLQDGRPRPALSPLFGPELRVVDTGLVPPADPVGRFGERRPEPRRARGRRAGALPGPGAAALAAGGASALVPGPLTPGPASPGAPATGLPAVVALDPARAALALPVPRIDPEDANAGFLAALVATAPGEVITALRAAPAPSVELRLRELRALIELGELPRVQDALAALEADFPSDWRVVWYRGLAALVAAADAPDPAAAETLVGAAADDFDALYDAFPGEAAPKLALGVCAELLGELEDAAEFYRLVWTTDPAYVSAAFGLARVLLAGGDREGAVRALESVPETSSHFVAARVAAVRARIRDRAPHDPLADDLAACSRAIGELPLDTRSRTELSVEVLDAALGWVLAGRPGRPGGAPTAAGAPGGSGGAGNAAGAGIRPGAAAALPVPPGRPSGSVATAPPAIPSVLGHPAEERELRLALEDSYRVLARLADRTEKRIEWVERANRTRPRTWV